MSDKAKRTLSESHLERLDVGRSEGRAVRDYLEALRDNRPKRGRKRTAETVARQLADIEAKIAVATAIEELKLVQDRRDLQRELSTMGNVIDLTIIEKEFVRVAKAYGQRKGISYASWREVGVSAAVLGKAGITRGAGS